MLDKGAAGADGGRKPTLAPRFHGAAPVVRRSLHWRPACQAGTRQASRFVFRSWQAQFAEPKALSHQA